MKAKTITFIAIIFTAVTCFICGKNYGLKSIISTEDEIVYLDNNLSEWQIMLMAIAKTESEFNPKAIGKAKDSGLLQITPIYVKEVNRILGDDIYTHDDAFDEEKSLAMFGIMQDRHNPNHNIDKAIKDHNPTATIAYANKVKKNMEFIREYEKVRALLID